MAREAATEVTTTQNTQHRQKRNIAIQFESMTITSIQSVGSRLNAVVLNSYRYAQLHAHFAHALSSKAHGDDVGVRLPRCLG